MFYISHKVGVHAQRVARENRNDEWFVENTANTSVLTDSCTRLETIGILK